MRKTKELIESNKSSNEIVSTLTEVSRSVLNYFVSELSKHSIFDIETNHVKWNGRSGEISFFAGPGGADWLVDLDVEIDREFEHIIQLRGSMSQYPSGGSPKKLGPIAIDTDDPGGRELIWPLDYALKSVILR